VSTQSTEEAYLRAVNSRNLAVKPEHACDADMLLLSGYVASKDPRKALALDVYRMLATGRMSDLNLVSERLAHAMVDKARPGGGYLRKAKPGLQLPQAKVIARVTLAWKHNSACPDCHGRGHPTYLNSPMLDETRDCESCKGTGVLPLEQLMQHEHASHARWLSSEIDALCSIVFSDMLRARTNLLSIK
jgi:hypothetical protein